MSSCHWRGIDRGIGWCLDAAFPLQGRVYHIVIRWLTVNSNVPEAMRSRAMSERDRSSNQSTSQSECGSDHRCGDRRSRRHRRGRRKERVLHTRISEQLSEDIRELADELRVPVSNLVRNVLEEVFTVVENVSDDVGDFVEDVVEEADGIRERVRKQQRATRSARRGARRRAAGRRGDTSDVTDIEEEFRSDEAAEADRAEPAGPKAAEDVLGWQPFVLNQQAPCARCGNTLEPGVNAFLGVRPNGETGPVVCPVCTRIA
ncbi:MAG: hypothetical protein QF570_02500 [Myxococcota bacterium]|nr:hypothetical protein [Myxococcota bacterium]